MKQFSLILNAVLLLAVAYLYYHVFSRPSTKQSAAIVTENKGTSAKTQGSIAYVDLDSLNEKITFIKQKRTELEAEQKAIENEYIRGIRGLETKRDNFLKRGNAITQQEAENFQAELIQQQQRIESTKQNSAQRLSEKSFKFMDDLQKQLKSFLKDYNAEKNYTYILTSGTGLDYMVYKDSTFDITRDVIEGMNNKLSQKK